MIEEQYDTAPEPGPEKALDSPAPLTGSKARPGSGLLPWVLLIALGWIGVLLAGPLPYQRQDVEWREPGGQTLRGELWLPLAQASSVQPNAQAKSRLLPGVILVHGVMASRAQPELAARYLARAGMVTLTFDLRGYGDSDKAPDTPEVHRQDVLSALTFLRSQPGVDAHRIALIGHSMGATAVSEAAAEDGHLSLARAMGMHGEGPVEWVTGLYDALHPPGMFKSVVISPAANHHVEWQDVWLLANHQRRLEGAFGLPTGPLGWQEWLLHASKCLLGLGFIGLLAGLWRPMPRTYARLALLTGGGAVLLAAGSFAWLDPGLCAQSLLLLLSGYVLSLVPPRRLKALLGIALGLFAARECAGLLRASPWLLAEPARLLWLPVYLLQSLLYYPLSLLQSLNQWLLPHSHTRLEASWMLGVVMLAEWLFPAWWLKLGGQLKVPQQRQKSTGLALGLGIIALAALLWIRLQQGYLAGDALQQTAKVLGTDILPTLGFFALGVWLWRKRARTAQMPPR